MSPEVSESIEMREALRRIIQTGQVSDEDKDHLRDLHNNYALIKRDKVGAMIKILQEW